MRFEVSSLPEAAREFDHLPRMVRERIYAALARLAVEERGDVRRLSGDLRGQYGLRVGEYRIRFRLEEDQATLVVVAVSTRSSAYRA